MFQGVHGRTAITSFMGRLSSDSNLADGQMVMAAENYEGPVVYEASGVANASGNSDVGNCAEKAAVQRKAKKQRRYHVSWNGLEIVAVEDDARSYLNAVKCEDMREAPWTPERREASWIDTDRQIETDN